MLIGSRDEMFVEGRGRIGPWFRWPREQRQIARERKPQRNGTQLKYEQKSTLQSIKSSPRTSYSPSTIHPQSIHNPSSLAPAAIFRHIFPSTLLEAKSLTKDKNMKSLPPLFSITTALAYPPSLDTRGNTVATGLFDVYNLAECVSTGLAAQVKEYQLPNGPCVDTPPNPDFAAAPFLSFRAGVQGGVPAGKQCYFDVYAGAGCTGNYQGFMSMDENNRTRQEVLVRTTGSSATVGGTSVKMSCFSA